MSLRRLCQVGEEVLLLAREKEKTNFLWEAGSELKKAGIPGREA